VNLTNRRVSGSVELPNAKGFELAALESVSDPTADALPDFRLAGYQWRIYHRTIPGASAR
jgi:hypothetical protein